MIENESSNSMGLDYELCSLLVNFCLDELMNISCHRHESEAAMREITEPARGFGSGRIDPKRSLLDVAKEV
jgi:hypothetical protein